MDGFAFVAAFEATNHEVSEHLALFFSTTKNFNQLFVISFRGGQEKGDRLSYYSVICLHAY
jgi:hypothetical protein